MVRTDRGDDLLTANEAAMDSLDIDLLFGGEDEGGDLLDDGLLNFDDLGVDDLAAPDSMFDYATMDGDRSIDNTDILLDDKNTTRTRTTQGYPLELAEKNDRSPSKKKATTRKNARKKRGAVEEANGDDDEVYNPSTAKRTRKRKKPYSDSTDPAIISTKLINIGTAIPLHFDLAPPGKGKKKTHNQRKLPTQRKRKSITINDDTTKINALPVHGPSTLDRSIEDINIQKPIPIPIPDPNLSTPIDDGYSFYPFTDAPVNDLEPLHTIYPNLYRIFSSSSPDGTNVSSHQNRDNNPLLKIIFDFVGTKIEIGQGQYDPNDADSLKNRDVHVLVDEASINKCKHYMAENIDKSVLIGELRSLLDKVKTQRTFLTKQMCQMTSWCKENFNDTQNGFQSSNFFESSSNYAHSVGVSQDVVDDIINITHPIPSSLKVKIQCIGFKNPDMAPLDAIMTPSQETSPLLMSCGVPIIKKRKKPPPLVMKSPILRKKIQKPLPLRPAPKPVKPTKPKPIVVKKKKHTFKDKSAVEKHKIITEILKERSLMFEQKVLKADTERQREINYRNEKLAYIIDQHTDRDMATDQFWEMAPLFAYWDEKSKEEIDNDLSTIWQPELPKRAMMWSEPPTPVIIKSDNTEKSANAKDESSLFDRLQSLLVEEEDSDEDEKSNYSDDEEMSDDDSISEIQSRDHKNARSGLVDLSELSLDQRTYIHLRSINLLDQPLLTSLVPAVVERSASFVNDALRRDELVNTMVRTKQLELSQLHRENNSKVSLLKKSVFDDLSKVIDDDKPEMSKTHNGKKRAHVEADADEWVPP